jgi:nitroreductase
MSLLPLLLTRRSTSVRDMREPAPSDAQLEQILRVATRVPDHGKLCPWRIVVLRGEGALKLGAIAADIFAKQNPDATEAHIAAEHTRFTRAPLCLAVLSTPILATKPVWEQQLSAGAVCMNILHAAHALGFGGKWLTEWVAYDAAIREELLAQAPNPPVDPSLASIAGFIYLGTKTLETPDRERPELASVVAGL